MSEELSKCPFCGEEPTESFWYATRSNKDCRLYGNLLGKKSWNRYAAESELARHREAAADGQPVMCRCEDYLCYKQSDDVRVCCHDKSDLAADYPRNIVVVNVVSLIARRNVKHE